MQVQRLIQWMLGLFPAVLVTYCYVTNYHNLPVKIKPIFYSLSVSRKSSMVQLGFCSASDTADCRVSTIFVLIPSSVSPHDSCYWQKSAPCSCNSRVPISRRLLLLSEGHLHSFLSGSFHPHSSKSFSHFRFLWLPLLPLSGESSLLSRAHVIRSRPPG